MSDNYYSNKKSQFKDEFNKNWDDNISDFLLFVSIQMQRELSGDIHNLSEVLKESTQDS
jgi:hypothetical protein